MPYTVKKFCFVRIFWRNYLAINSLLVSVSRWNRGWNHFAFMWIEFRGAVFIHVGSEKLCTENGVSFQMCSAVEVAC